MDLLLIGALILLAIVVIAVAVPLVQRQRRSGSVRAVMPKPTSEKGEPHE